MMTSVGVTLFCFDVTVVCHLFCIFHSWENKSIRILSHLVILGLSESQNKITDAAFVIECHGFGFFCLKSLKTI